MSVGLWEADEARARGYEEAIGGGEDMADDALLARCEVEGNLGGRGLGRVQVDDDAGFGFGVGKVAGVGETPAGGAGCCEERGSVPGAPGQSGVADGKGRR